VSVHPSAKVLHFGLLLQNSKASFNHITLLMGEGIQVCQDEVDTLSPSGDNSKSVEKMLKIF
jgi:hypothetical protein